MRCNNCGWENTPGNMKCEKCNAPLKGSMVGSGSGAPQGGSNNGSAGSSTPSITPLRGTLNERDSFGGGRENVGVNIDKENTKCPNCEYPVSPSMNMCPACGTSLSIAGGHVNPIARQNKCCGCGKSLTPGAQFCSNCGKPVRMGTINPGPQNANFFILRPIEWDKEAVKYKPVTYSGNVVDLNRSNTDPNNNSITSKLQAVISNINGEWYIEDKSPFQSTLIHVRGKAKLQDGDIIVMGNRKFEFKG